jgi:hypothetical protein
LDLICDQAQCLLLLGRDDAWLVINHADGSERVAFSVSQG